MKPLRISHFVEQGVISFCASYPAFIVECDDGLRYFSSADRWEAITPKSLPALRYDVKTHDIVYRLLRSPVDEKTITNAQGLFWNASITECDLELPSVVNGRCMYSNTKNLKGFHGIYDNLKHGELMFDGSGIEVCDLVAGSLLGATWICKNTKNLKGFLGTFNHLTKGSCMFEGSAIKLSEQEVENIIKAGGQFDIQSPRYPNSLELN